MGEARRKQTATQRFIAQFPRCCLCGGLRPAATREHMPPKSLFDNRHRPDKLVMPACDDCNRGTSCADLTVGIVSRWSYHINHQERLDHKRLIAGVRECDPDLLNEWIQLDPNRRNEARHHLMKHGVPVPLDAGLVSIGPLTIRQLNLFAHKAVLALYFEHFREPLPDTGRFSAMWNTKEDFFVHGGVPQLVLDMLPNHGTLVQGKWDERKTFEYRWATNESSGLFACFLRLRRALFVFGFAAADGSILAVVGDDLIKPSGLLATLDSPRFYQKLHAP